eukprot:TRINITY_DN1167_c0_g2_i1.p1 TRINITY_DN1167_c0_g2~~TRINITY_DN1167_c0_g2_i1.p1  ORF type:complete len:135 (+),score=20.02 TRINITY_DN1167_c0_g2_i1:232-636(+)
MNSRVHDVEQTGAILHDVFAVQAPLLNGVMNEIHATIRAIRADNADMNAKIEEQNTKIEEQNTTIADLNTKIADLNEKDVQKEAAIDSLNKKLKLTVAILSTNGVNPAVSINNQSIIGERSHSECRRCSRSNRG